MTMLALELHDVGIRVLRDDGTASSPSPGFAHWDGDEIETGEPALRRARLRPRFVHSRYWHDLDTTPVDRPFPPGLTFADLAHAQLEGLWHEHGDEVDEVVLAAAGCFSSRQLGLLVGIARAAGLPVAGLADAAVAAAVAEPLPATVGKLVHLDLHLHRTVATELTLAEGDDGDELHRRRLETAPVGRLALLDAWAGDIARRFVRRTRFDPLHDAATEQTLYDHLPGWLSDVAADGAAAIELGERGVEVELDDLVAAAEPLLLQIGDLARHFKRAGETTTLLLGHDLAVLPGVADRLGALSHTDLVPISSEAAVRGALSAAPSLAAAADGLDGEALPFVVRLPFPHPLPARAASATVGGSRERRAPTHLLHGHLAYRLDERPLVLGSRPPRDGRTLRLGGRRAGVSRRHCSLLGATDEGGARVEDHSSFGTFLNGERVAGRAPLAAGDRLRLGGADGVELVLLAEASLAGDDGET